jgi:hypothetical protein
MKSPTLLAHRIAPSFHPCGAACTNVGESGESIGGEQTNAHDESTMLRKLLFGCSHRFSWPMKRSDGTYYQVCVHCGAEYGYDWERMRRTTATPRQPQASANKGGCIERKSA